MPGVEMKLSARESVGESSNLMWGVVDMAVLDGGCEGDGDDAGGSQLRSSPRYTLCRREMDYTLGRGIRAVVSRSCTPPVGA